MYASEVESHELIEISQTDNKNHFEIFKIGAGIYKMEREVMSVKKSIFLKASIAGAPFTAFTVLSTESVRARLDLISVSYQSIGQSCNTW